MATSLITATATHGIGQFFEIAQALQNAELAYNESNALTPNFTPVNNISVVYDTEAMTATVTATLPIVITQTAAGATIKAEDYM